MVTTNISPQGSRTRGYRDPTAMRHWPREVRLTAAALGLAVGTSLAFLVLPAYSADGGDETLVEHEGWWVMAVLAIPC
jgi:hypothetical protein